MESLKHKNKGGLLKKAYTNNISKIPALTISVEQYQLWQSFADRARQNITFEARTGEIWSTLAKPVFPKAPKGTDRPRLVLILDGNGEVLQFKGVDYHKILVAPISTDIELATEWDYIIPENDSPLGYAFMIELWNKVTMLAENLNHGVGRISDNPTNHIMLLSKAQTNALVDESDADEQVFRNQTGSSKVEMGNEVYHFQRREIEDVEYLLQPVKSLSEFVAKDNMKKEPIFDKIKARKGNSTETSEEELKQLYASINGQ
jgi:hypothetical protein